MDSYFNAVKETTKEEKAFLIAYDMMCSEIKDENQLIDVLTSHIWNMLEAVEITGVKNITALVMISHTTMALALKKFDRGNQKEKEAICNSIKKIALLISETD